MPDDPTRTPPIFSSKLASARNTLLLMLAHDRHEGRLFSDLLQISGLSDSTLSMAKASLASAGLVREHCPSGDLRKLKLYLTDAGRLESDALWGSLVASVTLMAAWRAS